MSNKIVIIQVHSCLSGPGLSCLILGPGLDIAGCWSLFTYVKLAKLLLLREVNVNIKTGSVLGVNKLKISPTVGKKNRDEKQGKIKKEKTVKPTREK